MSLGKIRRLAPAIAERIAAGEIIERPASVVKELVENSLDAGASEVAVTLEGGGKELIEVLDNGEGMLPSDLELCIERHATSKLKSLEDLEKISSLGFRGEALPSIAAVSDLNILSRNKEGDSAYVLNIGDLLSRPDDPPKAEKLTFGQFINARHGTRIQARGLFSQIPARLKFLKSQSAEVSQVREWMERLALAFPQVGFKLLSDGKSVLDLRPESEEERIQSVLSEGENFPIIKATNENDSFRDQGLFVRLYWLQGLSTSQTRKMIQVVNSRAIRDRLLQQAVLGPFRQTLLPGRFPAVVVFLEINPAAIDVNVHPTKSEIRFLNSQKIFSSLDRLVKSMITQHGAPAVAAFSTDWTSPAQAFSGKENRFRPMHSEASSDSGWKFEASEPSLSSVTREYREMSPEESQGVLETVTTPSRPPQRLHTFLPQAKPIGILFDTYLLFEGAGEMILIDQHAAHERIRYEKLKRRVLEGKEGASAPLLSSQTLLIPETVRFKSEFKERIEKRISYLSKLGFDVELFGEETLLFRSAPVEWGMSRLKTRLANLVDRIIEAEIETAPQNEEVLMDEPLFEALASEACHSSVRAGDRLDISEAQALTEQLFQCEHPWNCPHGRPTVAKIPEGKIEEWFQRKV